MSLEQELKDLCAEANNNDYYLAGFVDGEKLESIIQKYIDPAYEYYNPHWGKRPTVYRTPTGLDKLISDAYANAIEKQLSTPLTFINLLKNEGTE